MAILKLSSIFTIGYIIINVTPRVKSYSTTHQIVATTVVALLVWVCWEGTKK